MKKKLLENPGLKLLALVMAVLLWLIIVNIEDPVDTKRFTNIAVTIQNESIILNDGKMYQITNDTATVDVTVSAKRSILTRIQSSDIVATANVENLQLDSMIPITITIPAYEGRYESAVTYPTNMQISIEDIKTNKFPITAELTGTLRDGYFVESTTITPDNVTISGPESVVSSISSVVARTNVSGVSSDTDLSGTLVLYDADNKEIDQSLLTTNLGDAGLTVSVHIMETLKVPISVSTTGIPASGYTVGEVTCEPSSVPLTGKEGVFENLSKIKIPPIDVSGKSETIETVIDLSDYLPAGASFADTDDEKVLVTVTIEKYGTKTINWPTGSIVVQNAPNGYSVSYPDTSEVAFEIQGREEALSKLSASDVKVTIDLSECTKGGEYTVPLSVRLPDGCSLSDSVEVKIKLKKDS